MKSGVIDNEYPRLFAGQFFCCIDCMNIRRVCDPDFNGPVFSQLQRYKLGALCKVFGDEPDGFFGYRILR
jgi:hypothetical protein